MITPFIAGAAGVIGAIDTHRVVITALKTLILFCGGLITFYASRAYRRTGGEALGALAVGFGLVTVGALVAGIVDQGLPLSRDVALVVESGFTAAGFVVVLWSLFRR